MACPHDLFGSNIISPPMGFIVAALSIPVMHAKQENSVPFPQLQRIRCVASLSHVSLSHLGVWSKSSSSMSSVPRSVVVSASGNGMGFSFLFGISFILP